jgi:hypothetical protein
MVSPAEKWVSIALPRGSTRVTVCPLSLAAASRSAGKANSTNLACRPANAADRWSAARLISGPSGIAG